MEGRVRNHPSGAIGAYRQGLSTPNAHGEADKNHSFDSGLASLLDCVGVDCVVIGGLSMGGQIVMEFCCLYPNRAAANYALRFIPRRVRF
jgi:pimeloyl-ACP methyl ester carboxylesterase